MGGKSKSSSSQTSKALTQNANQQGNQAPANILSLNAGDNYKSNTKVSLTLNQTETDYGAIEAAGYAVNRSIELSEAALDYYDRINSRALLEVSGANQRSVLEVSAANERALGFANDALAMVAESEDQQNFQSVLKWAIVGGGVFMVLKVIK